MNIEGLDYNIQREKLVLPQYGREIQSMIDYAVTLPTKEERQACAESIVAIMDRMNPQNRGNEGYLQKLWDHLALMSNFKLDIDYPFDVAQALSIAKKPEPLSYPQTVNPIRHYGSIIHQLCEQLQTMKPGEERDSLVCSVANQMKRDLVQWGRGACDDARVASDLARLTNGVIQLDLDNFRFEKINEKDFIQTRKKKR